VKGVIKKQTLEIIEEKTIKPAKVKDNSNHPELWKLEALQKQLEFLKTSVIPIPNKKG
jgi:hypothetical protein